MEDKTAKIIAGTMIVILVAVIIITRAVLGLSNPFFFITGASIAGILAVGACFFIRRHLNQRRKIMETKLALEGKELRIEYSFLRKIAGVPTKFRYKEIEEATDNFQSSIGRGASATVFKGILKDGTTVAVKRIDGGERGEKEFRSEISAIASVQHMNLVRLCGFCCVSSSLRFLVYEFIPNGSLDKWIFPSHGGSSAAISSGGGGCLPWEQRYNVAIDVAKALSYLHHDCRSRILHMDVKPENILLDENYKAVVSDFGLSKLMGRDESRVLTTLRGTKGYLAPEWLLELGVSEKSDVFSYGMVLLEIIGGRRNVMVVHDGSGDRSRRTFQYFPKTVVEKLKQGRIMEVVDERLLESGRRIEEREVRKLVYVALWCIQEKARRRPSMKEVVKWLEGREEVPEPPETQMIIVDLLCIDEAGSSGGDGGGGGGCGGGGGGGGKVEEEEEQNGKRTGRPRVVARVASQLVASSLPVSSRSYSFSLSMVSPR